MSKRRGEKMPLLDHVREFRSRLIKSVIAVLLFSICGWIFYQEIVRFLTLPICDLGESNLPTSSNCGDLFVNGILGPFNLQVKISLLSGVIFAAPVWIFQLWAFVTPALHKKERRTAFIFALIATPLFLMGAGLAFLILPNAVELLLGFTPNNLDNLVRFDEYLDFVLRMVLIFGFAFILPVFLTALNLLGLISGKSILRPWRIAVFSSFLFTAAFTPTPDPITMTLLAIPLCLIYFGAGFFALIVDRKRRRNTSPDSGVTSIPNPEDI